MTGRRRAGPGSPVSGRLTRLAAVVALLGAVALGATVVVPALFDSGGPLSPEPAQASDAASLVSLLNSARAANGMAPLSSASDLTAVAAERAQIMARSGSLSHTPDLGSRVCCWTWLAENAAYGGSVGIIHSLLMGSPPHRANIMYADADDVGVAVVSANGQLWAAQVFRARSDTGSASGRATSASGASRSGERTTPTTSVVAGPIGAAVTYSGPSPAELARRELRQRLHNLRADLKHDRHQTGPFDPVRAAVRYAGTLDRFSR